MLRTSAAGRSLLAHALMVALVTVASVLGLIGMHAFHPEGHVDHRPPTGAVTSHEHGHGPERALHEAAPLDPSPAQDASCAGCGTGEGHTAAMVLCLLTLLVSAAVALRGPWRPLLRRVAPLRVLDQGSLTSWLARAAPARPPSLQVLSVSRT